MRMLLGMLLVLCLVSVANAQPPWAGRRPVPPLGPNKPMIDKEAPIPGYLDRGPRGPHDPFRRGQRVPENFKNDKVFGNHFGHRGPSWGHKNYDNKHNKSFKKQEFRGNHKSGKGQKRCPCCGK